MTEAYQFASHAKPVLQSGEYQVTVTETCDIDPSCVISEVKQDFYVSSEQLTLDASMVYSVYPPKDSTGLYGDCLPHIVLKRCTLPWERVLLKDAHIPWLALLVFSEQDAFQEGSGPYGAVRQAPDTFVPVLERPVGDDEENCSYIDLSVSLFKEIIPAKEDLHFIAHTRHVSLDNKVTDATVKEGWFSLVTANRYPLNAKEPSETIRHTACLVSLEGFADYLEQPEHHSLCQKARVRMFTLFSWHFYSHGAPFDFQSLVKQLHADVLRVQTTLSPELDRLTALGYYPLDHLMREGSVAVSWYRPPLVPQMIPAEPLEPCLYADKLLRYDPALAMFDVSYSAAWQLGRMLALSNQPFAAAILAWRQKNKHRSVMAQNRRDLALALGYEMALGADAVSDGKTLEHACQGLWRDLITEAVEGTKRSMDIEVLQQCKEATVCAWNIKEEKEDPRWAGKNDFQWQQDPLCKGEADHKEDINDSLPETEPAYLAETLAKYALLYDVPFYYLVPGEQLLPENSIRFFYLHKSWIQAFLDGAMSLGRNASIELSHDKLFLEQVMGRAYRYGVNIRPQLQGLPDRLGEMEEICTGFLLRSPLVRGWRGLEFQGYGPAGFTEVLDALRIETLAGDVLLGIYNGSLQRLEILEPPEGFHYGFNREETCFSKRLRRLSDGVLTETSFEVAPRLDPAGNPVGRTIDLHRTAGNMAEKLKVQGWLEEPDVVTSAHMALQMIQNPHKAVLQETDSEVFLTNKENI